MPDYSTSKKILACTLFFFTVLSILAFLLHFHSIHGFFHFELERKPYDSTKLFDALVSGRGHRFFVAHFIVYLAIPFLLVDMLILSWYLFPSNQYMAFIGAAFGIIGCLAMASVIACWLSYAAIGRVQPEYYEGAKAALIELTKKEGFFKWDTVGSYFAFAGLIVLASGLLAYRQFPIRYMCCILFGSFLFIFFMDMDNWMLIGTLFIAIGLLPVIKRLWKE